ncbi:tyrosine-type recombinase/integrase [Fulvimarina sp. MAC3]|uniref:tyrosine-type recombinase/integrase n=1 Tax=Fulvimarina sp. MAC3 TaxID=3148887 RepID=UPI0031FD5E6D
MSVRRRTWTTNGVEKSAWVCDYVDGSGKRRLKSFARKKEADAFAATASVEVRDGTHVADSASATIENAANLWLKSCERRVEHGTLVQYRQHVRLHIVPMIGHTLLSRLTVPSVRQFEEDMIAAGRSSSMLRKVMVTLGSIISDAQERGLVVRNAVRDKGRARQKGRDRRAEKRQRGRLKVGVDIPTRDEVKALIGVLEGRWRPAMLTFIFAGLRASELRGLRWEDVDLDRGLIHVRQRADFLNTIGAPKSEAGERTVPVLPMVVNALREWKLACPIGDLGLAFPNGAGNVESHTNIVKRGLHPAWINAGVIVEGDDGPLPKYTGLHSLRHFFASWCINRKEDGGLGLPPKSVQERLGHATIALTMDTYSHLFPSNDDAAELALAEAAFLG